ncbi:endonuclease/exonuclease/phosphatase family protein [Nocardioides sp. CER19]|uniref:endonuclease/exonuclease/phosphatase family protein n=1 Tax=Nocardioides sp. CER19 TaxID=3038538 RepID=UPI00244C9E09|nr:endonuclease/exonuclease/phosphatase family protein [Nocardioides sp. CER19]MDH2413420.1 endonuclease/exonuclease/phosphatase family protein [Nocardioides sp. CER19]
MRRPRRRAPRRLVVLAAAVLMAVPAAPGRADAQPAGATGTFFWANAWAAHHTAARGASSGPQRMRRLVRLVERADIGLGALAEVEHSQVVAFRRAAPTYQLLTGGRGNTVGVFWDTTAYDLVQSYRFRGFSYGGRRVRLPVAVLRDHASSDLLALIAVHNPRDRWRDSALRRELQEVRNVRRAYDGRVAVFVAGDFNAGDSVACRAHRAGLVSVAQRRCRGSAPIDQLLVDRAVRIRGYRPLSGRRVGRITDHPAVYRARFTLSPSTT